MKKRVFAFLFIAGLTLFSIAGQFIHSPGYMDADYAFSMGQQLVNGHGFWEPYAWNFLDQTYLLPHPAFSYWMPLSAIISAFGMLLIGGSSFFGSQILFIFISALISPITCQLCWQITHDNKMAIAAGVFALVPGYYWIYYIIPENISLFILLGGVFFIVTLSKSLPSLLRPLILGVIAGLMHLSRADGIIWLFASIMVIIITNIVFRKKIIALFLIIFGYLIISGFWYILNIQHYNAIFPPGGISTLWMTSYNDIFTFFPSQLTFSNWIASGINTIIMARWDAFILNIKNILAVQGIILLAPFILLGLWELRREKVIQLALSLYIVFFFLMTMLFPFSGSRGGLLHSGSAFQCIFWAVAPIGFKKVLGLGVKIRKWDLSCAWQMFYPALVSILFLLSLFLFTRQIYAGRWDQEMAQYQEIELMLTQNGAVASSRIMISNPPGYFAVNHRMGIVTPNGNVTLLLIAARRYDINFLVLDDAHVVGLNELYENPGLSQYLIYIGNVGDSEIFRILNE